MRRLKKNKAIRSVVSFSKIAVLLIGLLLLNTTHADNRNNPMVALENDHVRVTEWFLSENSPIQMRELRSGAMINLHRVRIRKTSDTGDESKVDYQRSLSA